MLKYSGFVNEEVGIRNLKNIVSGHTQMEIWFHKDLDGVCSAVAFKHFFKTYYSIDLVDCHIIQYGGMEFAVKTGKEGTLKLICDFAHGKPMFQIQSDHHDKQVGADETKGKYFKPARSNVETISGEISYSDVFSQSDIDLIKVVDSADFLSHDISPKDVQNSIFSYDRKMSGKKNRFMMGFVVNRLLLAYKNKRITCKSLDGKNDHINRNILECLVMDSSPSLYSMFNNIKHYVNVAKTKDKLGVLAKPEVLMKNLSDYAERMKNYRFVETGEGEAEHYDPENWRHRSAVSGGSKISKGVHFDEESKIISQYGGGSMFNPGSYDRYVPFKNNPEANFICIVWPMGLIQVSCNPFREKKLKDINLGEIAKEVISKHKSNFESIFIPLEGVKRELEYSQDWKKMSKDEGPGYKGVGFRYSDLNAFYKDCVYKEVDGKLVLLSELPDDLKKHMDLTYENMNGFERDFLKQFKVPLIELINRNSGGHPSITNIQGFNFLKYDRKSLEKFYKTEKYTDVMKTFARDFINTLKDKISKIESGEKIEYTSSDVELMGHDTNEGKTHNQSSRDRIKGGIADGISIEDIANKHEVGIDKIKNQLRKGIVVEFEHTDDRELAEEIAMDHLWEIPNYYDKLESIEESKKSRKIKSFNEFKSGRVNEEFIGKIFRSLKNKLSLKFSKMFGTSKEADKLIEEYKKEITQAHTKKNEALKQYGLYIKASEETSEVDKNKVNQLIKNIDIATKNYDDQIKLIKKKFDIKFSEVMSKEDNPKIKNYIELKKIEMLQELLSQETNALLSDEEMDESKIKDPKFIEMINIIKTRVKESESMAKKQKDMLEKNTMGFDVEKAKNLYDKGEDYTWEKSPFPKHKFEEGEKITYFSKKNYKSSSDKTEYPGTDATVKKDNGDKILVDTKSSNDLQIPKSSVIKSESYDRIKKSKDVENNEI